MDEETTVILKYQDDFVFLGVLHNCVNYSKEKRYEISGIRIKKEKNFKKYLKITKGDYVLDYNSSEIKLKYYEKGMPLSVDAATKIHHEIMLTGMGRVLEEFLKESVKYYNDEILDNKKTDKKINYYIWDDYWESINKKPTRDINTLYFSDNIHLELLSEISHFLSEEEEKEYREYGIPYKMCVLLEGYPGTGKTSLITAIASELGFNIATISFDQNMNDKNLFRALKNMPAKTILLLEDIDVLFKERKENDNYKSALSFSGLINGIDGCGSVDKQIIFMTTNYVCNLDCALKRPGRVDKIIHFDYCNKKQIKLMYTKFLKNRENKFDTFYREISSLKLTTAMLQKYFFENRKTDCLSRNIDDLKKLAKTQKYEGNLNFYS